jgi:hypothetical protein
MPGWARERIWPLTIAACSTDIFATTSSKSGNEFFQVIFSVCWLEKQQKFVIFCFMKHVPPGNRDS